VHEPGHMSLWVRYSHLSTNKTTLYCEHFLPRGRQKDTTSGLITSERLALISAVELHKGICGGNISLRTQKKKRRKTGAPNLA